MSSQLAKHWITADEYECMGEAGVFGDARLELIEGEIYEMSPIGSPHAACIKFLNGFFHRTLGNRVIIGVQDPVRLSDFSVPQPDISVLKWRDDFYRHAHPTAADVLLLIEVADTTLKTDRAVKLPLYARAGVAEVWIVNLPESQVEVYASPEGDAYQSMKIYERGTETRSHTLAGLTVAVSEIVGS